MTNTDPARFEVLAPRYRSEAEICLEMPERTDGALSRALVLAAARWIELAQTGGDADGCVVVNDRDDRRRRQDDPPGAGRRLTSMVAQAKLS
jgi:hypothetical protein